MPRTHNSYKEDTPGTNIYLTKKIRQELIYILQRGYARSSYISYKEDTPGLTYLTRKIYQELIYLLQGRCHELIYLLGKLFFVYIKSVLQFLW